MTRYFSESMGVPHEQLSQDHLDRAKAMLSKFHTVATLENVGSGFLESLGWPASMAALLQQPENRDGRLDDEDAIPTAEIEAWNAWDRQLYEHFKAKEANAAEVARVAEVAQTDFSVEVAPAADGPAVHYLSAEVAVPDAHAAVRPLAGPLGALRLELTRPAAHALVLALLGCTVALHAWLCGSGAAQFAPEVRTKAAAAYAGYVALSLMMHVSTKLAMRYSPGTATAMSALELVAACLVVKIAMSACFYGHEIGWSRSLFSEEVLRGAGTILRCGIPGLLYVAADCLRVYALLGVDLASFNAVLANRVMVTALLWVSFNNQSLSAQKWACLGLMSLGTYVAHQGEVGTAVMPETRYYGAAFASVFFACLAAVINERMLKSEPVRLNLQNLGTYVLGLAGLVAGAALHPQARLSPLAWFQGSAYSDLAIGTLACLGIVTAHFLKVLSNLWKEVAIACQVVLAFAIEAVLFGTTYTAMTAAGVSAVFLGMAGFALDGLGEAKDAGAETEQEPLIGDRSRDE